MRSLLAAFAFTARITQGATADAREIQAGTPAVLFAAANEAGIAARALGEGKAAAAAGKLAAAADRPSIAHIDPSDR